VTLATRIAVIGAGPAGLAAAHRLAQLGYRVTVFEAGPTLGGLARSLDLWGRSVDLGPHVIAGGNRRGLALWSELCRTDAVQLAVRRGIITPDGVLEYPVRAANVLRRLSAFDIARSAIGLMAARLLRQPDADTNAERWMVAHYGRPIYELLIRSYFEKQWGSGAQIDASFARSLFGGTLRTARTADDEPIGQHFWYPRGACAAVWNRLSDSLPEHADVERNTPIDALHVRDGAVCGVRVGGSVREFAHVVSTMPIARLVRLLPSRSEEVDAALSRLRARHVVTVHLLVQAMQRLPHLWLYVLDRELHVARVSDWRNWDPARYGNDETVLTMEYWCDDNDDLLSRDDASVISVAGAELRRIKPLAAARVIDGRVTRSPRALPVPAVGHRESLDAIHRHLDGFPGVTTLGRHGNFASSSVVDVLGEGLRVADRISATLAATTPA
jgi:protoporphyrinogen oxidase